MRFITSKKYFLAIVLLLLSAPYASAQQDYAPEKTRILFLLDASGSMVEEWEGSTKFEVAKKLLIEIVDSLSKEEDKIEFGLRMFGHQSPKVDHNCEDSKLEVSFSPTSHMKFKSAMDAATPQGYTPIAYSIFKAANDFPNDGKSKNAIVLITDGIENCDGDPCAAALVLQQKRISLKPFIVGLGINQTDLSFFDCVGKYYDASDTRTFENVVNVVVSTALNTTSAQVNLLSQDVKPIETDVEMTFYNSWTGEVAYNFMHTMNEFERPDTLYLDPTGMYDLVVHTIPPVRVDSIELNPGKHNIIAADAPQGTLEIKLEAGMHLKNTQCIVRSDRTNEILYVQDMNVVQKYIIGDYDVEVLTLPRTIFHSVRVRQSQETIREIPQPGRLNLYSRSSAIISIYEEDEGKLKRVIELPKLEGREAIMLQPGKYQIVYRPNDTYRSAVTQTRTFEVESQKMLSIDF